MKKYVIYKITNSLNGKIYIGFHGIPLNEKVKSFSVGSSIFRDQYFGSGKLIRRSVQKNGIENFRQELLFETVSREEAESKEAELVDAEFTLREDTYNISLGGNVRIFCGENNPFYGKKHPPELLEIISKRTKGNKYFSNAKDNRVMVVSTGEIFLDYVDLKKAGHVKSKRQLFRSVEKGFFRFMDEEKQSRVLEMCKRWMSDEEKKALLSDLCRERFRGQVLSPETRNKLGESVRSWIANNPEKHQERMLKINKNPDKIRKMAEKHRGMKRSVEARKNISESLKGKPSHSKGRLTAYDPLAKPPKTKYFDTAEEIPTGWTMGMATKGKKRGTSYTDGVVYKLFLNDIDVPEGWYKQGPPKKKAAIHE